MVFSGLNNTMYAGAAVSALIGYNFAPQYGYTPLMGALLAPVAAYVVFRVAVSISNSSSSI